VHVYSEADQYQISLMVTDNIGAISLSITEVSVTPIGDMDLDGDIDMEDFRAFIIAISREQLFN